MNLICWKIQFSTCSSILPFSSAFLLCCAFVVHLSKLIYFLYHFGLWQNNNLNKRKEEENLGRMVMAVALKFKAIVKVRERERMIE